jgi:hypothetical protein
MKPILLAVLLISLASCVPATRDQDVANSAQTAYNYAATLPPSAATTQIMLQCVAIGHAMGHEIVPATAPTTPAPATAGKATPK